MFSFFLDSPSHLRERHKKKNKGAFRWIKKYSCYKLRNVVVLDTTDRPKGKEKEKKGGGGRKEGIREL